MNERIQIRVDEDMKTSFDEKTRFHSRQEILRGLIDTVNKQDIEATLNYINMVKYPHRER